MAFLATNLIPATQYNRAKELCIQVKNLAQNRSALLANGANSDELLSIAENCNVYYGLLNAIKSTPGILQYAKDQEDDPLYDVAAEFNTVLTNLQNVTNEIVTSLPTDVNDWLLVRTVNADGTTTPRNFTAAQVATIKSLIDTLDASIS